MVGVVAVVAVGVGVAVAVVAVVAVGVGVAVVAVVAVGVGVAVAVGVVVGVVVVVAVGVVIRVHQRLEYILSTSLIAEADEVGWERHNNAIRRGRPDANNLARDDRNSVSIHLLGARCEVAAREFYRLPPGSWLGFLDAPNLDGLPDLAGFIDVKGVVKDHHCLTVPAPAPPAKPKLVRDYAYLLVRGTRHPVYEIVGWLWGHEVEKHPISDPTGKNRPAHFVKPDRLRSPNELWVELDERDPLSTLMG